MAMVVDAGLVALSLAAALLVRFDGDVPLEYRTNALTCLPVAVLAVLLANQAAGLYSQNSREAGISRRHVLAAASVFLLLFTLNLWLYLLPLTVIGLTALLYTATSGLMRFQARLRASSSWLSRWRFPPRPS